MDAGGQANGLLALDISTRCGWAYADSDYVPSATDLEVAGGNRPPAPQSGVNRIGPPGASIGHVLDEYDTFLLDHIAIFSPRVLVFEAPILTSGKTHISTARKLLGMAAWTEAVCRRKSIRCWEVNISQVKKHLTGNGRASKEDMIAACYRRGWRPKDDNQADALAVLDFAFYAILSKKRGAR